MPAPTLTPTETSTDYQLVVSQADLNDAAQQIYALTAYTLADHVDVRGVAEGSVRRAWAIVAARLREGTSGDGDRAVTGESERDYSYSEDATMKAAGQLSLLAGIPNQLLQIGGSWGSFSTEGDRRASHSGGRGVPPTIDYYGVEFR